MAIYNQPIMSRTQHYRKVTKPLLERKRRARMNHYLDELKELIIETMESNGEHVTKLEKADILELTVEFLKSKKGQQFRNQHQQQQLHHHNHQESGLIGTSSEGQQSFKTNVINVEKFRAGYTQAAYEVSKVFATVPGVNVKFGTSLMKHLAYQLKDLYPSSSKTSISTNSDDDESKFVSMSPEHVTFQQFDNNRIALSYHNQHHNNHHHPYLCYDQNQQKQENQQQQSQQYHNIIIGEHQNLPSGNEVWRPW